MEGFTLASSRLPFASSLNPQNEFFGASHFPFLPRLPSSLSIDWKIGKSSTRRCIYVSSLGNRSAWQSSYKNGEILCGLDSARSFPSWAKHFKAHTEAKHRWEVFSSISSSSSGKETSSVGVTPQHPISPPPSQIGSPLFWVGVGVAVSALFSWAASYLKKYAMQQAFKTMMGQMASQNSPFSGDPFTPSPPFPFPSATTPRTPVPPAPVAAQPSMAVDVTATKVETAPTEEAHASTEERKESKKYEFVDVSPEELVQKQTHESSETSSSKKIHYAEPVLNGSLPKQGATAGDSSYSTPGKSGSVLSIDALEKMMEDPTVQKMVYPYLPEEMRNPATFKWMLQNPQYRQQLEDMLNNMGGSNEWDNRLMDSLKNFDLSSPEVKQQFDQIGLTPEEVISKIMSNPDVAMSFQNPRVQAAIMDCSQNPMNITKYQNDKEVMDVFNKISELFPGVGGPL